MNIIKRHKGLAIIGGLSLILLIILFAIFSRMIFSSGKDNYGDRLNGVAKIKQSVLDDAKNYLEGIGEVEKANVRVQGKIVYTTIYVSSTTSKDKAKEIASGSIAKYEKEVIDNYDFEFLIHQNLAVKDGEEDKSYTIAGTKHPNKDKISWIKN